MLPHVRLKTLQVHKLGSPSGGSLCICIRMMGVQELMVTVATSLCSASLRLKKTTLFAQKTYVLKPTYILDDNRTLLLQRCCKTDDTILANGEADRRRHVAFQSILVSFCDADQ